MFVGVGQAVAPGDFGKPPVADADGGNLRGQVALPVVRRAGIAADEGNDLLVDATAVGQLQGRDNQPFLVQFRGQGH